MQHFFTIIFAAIGLSMDAFSLALALGTFNYNKKTIITISILVGLFHFFMPLIGNAIGEQLLRLILIKSSTITGIIFMILSLQMLISVFKEEQVRAVSNSFSCIAFALTVSIDSFSFGIGLSGISHEHMFVGTIFMIVSSLFTFAGLIAGKKLSKLFGKYATFTGSIILLILSINYIL